MRKAVFATMGFVICCICSRPIFRFRSRQSAGTLVAWVATVMKSLYFHQSWNVLRASRSLIDETFSDGVDLAVAISDQRSSRGVRRGCKYHVVFTPKCCRKALYGELRRYLGEVFRKLAAKASASKPADSRLFRATTSRKTASALARVVEELWIQLWKFLVHVSISISTKSTSYDSIAEELWVTLQ